MASDPKLSNPFLTPEESSASQASSADVIRSDARPSESSRATISLREPARPAFPATPPEISPRVVSNATQSPSIPSIAPQVLEPKSRRGRYILWVVYGLLIFFVGAAIWYGWSRFKPIPENTDLASSVPTPMERTEIAEIVPIETITTEAEYSSENFRAGEIVFGGELAFLQSEDNIAPLTISAIRGEAFTEKTKQEVKLVVTWQTNKLSLADVEYAKGVGQNKKKMAEDDYSFNHSVIIGGLEPASTYLYTIKATDRFGNVVTSEPYAVFTGAKSVSLFDLIAGAIGDVFGWAVDK